MKLAVFWALAWRLAVFLSVPVLTLRRSFAFLPQINAQPAVFMLIV